MAFLKPQKADLYGEPIRLNNPTVFADGDNRKTVVHFFSERQIKISAEGTIHIKTVHCDSRATTYIEQTRRLTGEKYILTVNEANEAVEIEIRYGGKRGLFYALCDLYRRITTQTLSSGTIENYPLFAIRGYIEGFYGKPWSVSERKEMLHTLAPCGINSYFYAPKDDPYHRAHWQRPYPQETIESLRELVDCAKSCYVDFWYCLAPGLDVCYSAEEHLLCMYEKYLQLYAIGVRHFGLLLDDIPSSLRYEQDKEQYPDTVHAHADLTNRLAERLKTYDREIRLVVCPMQYHGKSDAYYISKLGHLLDPSVLLFWTGRNICAQELTVPEAILFREHTLHRPLYWDNYPVNDAEMTHQMHIAPIVGRDHRLYLYSEGIVSNCMPQFQCSKIPLLTIADYLWNPEQYDPQTSWADALHAVLGEDADLFVFFAEHLSFSCLQSPSSDRMVDAFTDFDWSAPFVRPLPLHLSYYISTVCDCMRLLNMHVCKGDQLYIELLPWIQKFNCFSETLQLCSLYFQTKERSVLGEIKQKLYAFDRLPEEMTDFTFRACIEALLQSANEVC